MSPIDRRRFLALTAAGLASGMVAETASADDEQSQANPLAVFTKPFNSLSFEELAEEIAGLGFDGLEAPIRKGGHIDPANVVDELPRLVEALAKHNLQVTVMASDINDASDPATERVIRTAATLGIKRYRMKYVKYSNDRSVADHIASWKSQFKDLAAVNHDYGVTGLYQNHAGVNYMGSSIWDLDQVLEGIAPSEIGMAYDIRHATVEGGTSWPTTYRMIRDHIDTVYVKDFAWDNGKVKNVPLGEGLVQAKFFDMLRKDQFHGPISLHEEYIDHHPAELVPQHITAIEKDLKTLRQWLKQG
ncbi:sugar phosphate isomerase/epimerase family protein [Roseiconus lacunae]|uniref:sugar phosphate isomerase/epimerase family protein n=1 Tax=Roseiconus lacunae TaxID=2605694 RepID=UPI001E6516C9|nr:sugar phosphate isomerase/epimerase family protein [Roseiconus lacunae]MCD0458482.1 sugar phosphate isomerase/epimerase [Roseiconus lacunae]